MNRRAAWVGAALLVIAGGAYLLPPTGTPGPGSSASDACGVEPGMLSGGPVRMPIAGAFTVTSEYGMRVNPTDGVYQMHAGIDLSSSAAAPIVAMAAGTVTFAGFAGTAGNMVVVDHGDGVTTRSMHMSRLSVRQGQVVGAGDPVGVEGTTGDSTGPHLHFEVKVDGAPVDPRAWLSRSGVSLPGLGGQGSGPEPAPAGARQVSLARRVPDACRPESADLRGDAVPPEFLPWVVKASTVCRQVSAPVLAAQIETESGWNPRAVSPAGAQGASQFMPGTWPAYGRDDDGNGVASPFDIGDAVMAQARYGCAIAGSLDGTVPGDALDLALAGYNAGPGAVLLHGGIPPYRETQAYVTRIRGLAMGKYSALGSALQAVDAR